MITIKEYASQRGVSAQSVHQKIKRNQKELGEHIHVEKGVKYLDDVAINILEGTTEHQKSQKQAKQTLISPDVKKELDELREENTRLKSDLIKKQDELIISKDKYENALEQVVLAQKLLQEKDKQLLEYQKQEEKDTKSLDPDENTTKKDEVLNPEPKKNWFKRLFKRN